MHSDDYHTELSLYQSRGVLVGFQGGGKEDWWAEGKGGEGRRQIDTTSKKWEYWDGDKWESDPTLECSRQVLPGCTEVIVELGGEAKERLAGSYLPVKGKINRGR